jgi:peptidylprolyl isomerase
MNKLKQNHIIIIAFITLLIVLYFMIAKNDSGTEPESVSPINVVLETTKGDIELLLYADKVPKTVENFVELARGDFYDDVKFHRVIKKFMIQSGDPKTKHDSLMDEWGRGGPGYMIEDEFVEGLSNMRGTISMANSGPNTGGSQWFINLVDNQNLDFDKYPPESKHAVFGKVIAGMDVVDAIGNVPTEGPDRPIEPVVIEDVVIK